MEQSSPLVILFLHGCWKNWLPSATASSICPSPVLTLQEPRVVFILTIGMSDFHQTLFNFLLLPKVLPTTINRFLRGVHHQCVLLLEEPGRSFVPILSLEVILFSYNYGAAPWALLDPLVPLARLDIRPSLWRVAQGPPPWTRRRQDLYSGFPSTLLASSCTIAPSVTKQLLFLSFSGNDLCLPLRGIALKFFLLTVSVRVSQQRSVYPLTVPYRQVEDR